MKEQTKLMYREIVGSLVLFACFLAMAVATMVVLGSCGGDKSTERITGNIYQYYHPGSNNPFYQMTPRDFDGHGAPPVEGDPEPPHLKDGDPDPLIAVSSATDISGWYTEEEFEEQFGELDAIVGGGRNPWSNCPAGTYVGLHCGLNGIGMWICHWSSECESFSGID